MAWNYNARGTALLAAAFTWASAAVKADEPVLTGEQIYSKQCVDCHGAKGEGVKGEHEEPLVGDWSLEKLTKYVTKNMPEDKPKLCEGEDARRVAKFVFDAFYSLEAQLRNNPPRVTTSRLTTRQFRESVADLFIREPASQPTSEPGLKGFYFVSKGMNKKDGLKKTQVDERIDFDFGANPPAEGIKPEQFSIAWEGSIRARETGYYEFRVTTPNGARLYLNVNLKEGDKNYRDDASKESQHPLIDAWVSSGNKTRQETARVFLLGGRQYPMRLDFFKYKEKTGAIRFEWLPPHGTWETPSGKDFSTHMPDRLVVTETSFPADDRSLGYERGSAVSREWLDATTLAALEVAEQVDLNLGVLSGMKSKKDPKSREKLKEFAAGIMERAYRRPLSKEERERGVDKIFAEVDSPDLAVKRVVLLALKSPHFLYPDLPTGKPGPYRIASRLALGLWDSIPDERLLSAAREGKLANKEQVAKQA
ncbi:uncharacterized protein METZ01_LOCUS194909, partial [marine metagenome]